MDTKLRTTVKATLWALIGLIVMTLVGYIATGSVTTGGAMALVNALIGLVSYALYERVWAHIRWGRL